MVHPAGGAGLFPSTVSDFQFSDFPGTGNRQQATGNKQQATGNRQQATGNRQRATGNRQEAAGNRQQAAGNKQFATGNRQQATNNRQRATSITPHIPGSCLWGSNLKGNDRKSKPITQKTNERPLFPAFK